MATSSLEEPKLPGGYLVTPRVPQGLAAAVEGLTREVIRHSPEDIYVFAAHHFEKLLILREQCGVTRKRSSRSDENIRTMREMSRALKMREIDRANSRTTRNTYDQVGWSLNQTAKVLKRHRSIFGDEGRRITTDEVFRMASEKENRSNPPKSPSINHENRAKRCNVERRTNEKTAELWKASTSRTQHSSSNDDSIENNEANAERTKAGPRIITQIPNLPSGTIMLAKDIKTELRKNRISSRERRNAAGKHEDKSTFDGSASKVVKSSGKIISSKKPSERQKRMETNVEQKRDRKNYDSRSSREHDSKSTIEDSTRNSQVIGKILAPNTNRVKDYVVQRFATTKSLEELQTANYVEKVQDIIDETGPIIKEKIEQLKSDIMGRSRKSSWFGDVEKNRNGGSNDSYSDKRNSLEYSEQKESPDERAISTSDALRARLTETQNLMENVSSSLATRSSSRRSRSARSSRRLKNAEINPDESLIFAKSRDDSWQFENRDDDNVEAKLLKNQNLFEDKSYGLSGSTRRSCSAKNLSKCHETTEDVGNKDALKKRLDETRNLLRGISANFGRSEERRSRSKTRIDSVELDDRMMSKVSLPAVRSVSMRNSSGSVSHSDSENLVLPAISPEAPKSAKIKEDLILPVLSPSGTTSTNDDSGRMIEINDDVLLTEFDITDIPIEDYVPEEPADNVSRDSLNVTPDFDSIPQRPDSLEPQEMIDDLETENVNVGDLQTTTSEIDELGAKSLEAGDLDTKIMEVSDLGDKTSELGDLEKATPELDDPGTKILEVGGLETKISTVNDLETRLQEIQKVERDIEEVFVEKTASDSRESENSIMMKKLREVEEAEKRIDRIFDKDNRPGSTADSEKAANAGDSGRNVDEEIDIEENEFKRGKIDDQEELKFEERGNDESSIVSPEVTNYTYVLTEGSPHDIPDTVTTVIIPERTVASPLSDRPSLEPEDYLEAKLSPIPDDLPCKSSSEDLVKKNVEFNDNELIKSDIDDERRKYSEANDRKSSTDNIAKETTTSDEKMMKNTSDPGENDSSRKIRSDLFGEFVRPESNVQTSADINFIREIETIQDLQINRQDLGRINEEVSEDLEDRENVTKTEEDKEEMLPKIEEEIEEEKNIIVDDVEVDKLKPNESDVSPEATRLYLDSESSNETKESGAADETLESSRRKNSLDEEDMSDTRTVESSNEVKETTLTDGFSLSLDPTRPFVPELNLDSLQDITVSSFKMTENEYENHERGESENTNSPTGTLTSDENNRAIDNDELVEEAVVEYPVSLTSRSRLDEAEHDERTIVEETIVKSRVEVGEDVCEKTSAWVTGPSKEEGNIDDDDDDDDDDKLPEVQKEEEEKLKEQDGDEKSKELANVDVIISGKEEEEEIANEEHEEIEKMKDINEEILTPKKDKENASMEEKEEIEEVRTVESFTENEKIVNEDKENGSTVKKEKDEITEKEDVQENVEIVNTEKDEDNTLKEENEDIRSKECLNDDENVEDVRTEEDEEKDEHSEKKDSNESESVEIVKMENEEEKCETGKRMEDEGERDSLLSYENLEFELVKEDDGKSRSSERDFENRSGTSNLQKKEEMKNDIGEAELLAETTDSVDKGKRHSMENEKFDDLNEEMQTEEEENDDVLEESYVEEETPLAVSRSASQCTTRRVSSGNLAKLREDPTLGWTEETEREDHEDDASLSKVKFSGINDETIKEQISDEMDEKFIAPRDEIFTNDVRTTKDSKEYHIYVPEVNGSDDNSTTESSTFDSAVTKIQAGVRGFLTRRRLQRGQQNRSSTLNSIPSIQDSIAIERYSTDDREHNVEDEKNDRIEEMNISSSIASKDYGLVNAATRIQNNYRAYKTRKRLTREDAVQRTTLSLEKSFADSGLQHTGEFHDCIPLPIHDIPIKKITSNISKDHGVNDKNEHSNKSIEQLTSPESLQWMDVDREDLTSSDREKMSKSSLPIDSEKMFLGQSSNVPIIQFGAIPSVSQLVDLVVLAKDDVALQNSYLNFITSVEDTETIVGPAEIPLSIKNFPEDEKISRESLREPLALSDPPIGAIIQEVTSLDADNFMKSHDDHDRTTTSTNSSSLPPEVNENSLNSPRAPCASSETVSVSVEAEQAEGDVSNRSDIQQEEIESSRTTNEVYERSEDPRKTLDNGDETKANAVPETETMIEDFAIAENLSSFGEKELLGPESAVDSMECPIDRSNEKNSSDTLDLKNDASEVTTEVTEEMTEKNVSPTRVSSDRSEIVEERTKEESMGSNVDEVSSMLSFSMKVEDLLDFGSEESIEFHGKKPILEVTLSPGNFMKSMSLSQESQLAGERIESPITMIQIAPERSESLQQDELSDNGDNDDTTNGKQTKSPRSEKLDKK